MTQYFEFSFSSGSSAETVAMGKRLGSLLTAGSVIGLMGDLGAGKTCFIKGIAEGFNKTPEADVTSPSFTILQEYPGPVPLYHFDAYRLSGSDDLEAIGFNEYVGSDSVAVIEWADRIRDALPRDILLITIQWVSENQRSFLCRATGEQHRQTLCLFQKSFAGGPV